MKSQQSRFPDVESTARLASMMEDELFEKIRSFVNESSHCLTSDDGCKQDEFAMACYYNWTNHSLCQMVNGDILGKAYQHVVRGVDINRARFMLSYYWDRVFEDYVGHGLNEPSICDMPEKDVRRLFEEGFRMAFEDYMQSVGVEVEDEMMCG